MTATLERPIAVDLLRRHDPEPVPIVEKISPDHLRAIAAERLGPSVRADFFDPVLELSARRPHDPLLGRLDIVNVGRWNTASDLVHMKPIAAAPGPGQSAGSIGYGIFMPQSSRFHLVAVQFTGQNVTMEIASPFGAASDHTATASQTGVVMGWWNLTAGSTLYFSIRCSGSGTGYIQSVRVY